MHVDVARVVAARAAGVKVFAPSATISTPVGSTSWSISVRRRRPGPLRRRRGGRRRRRGLPPGRAAGPAHVPTR
ncbi:hypothetical protein I553_1439 [Mycobacterium xenopi 4042]|uniref:Uncharacterized protein n=1 Tax=Mycobacterium xenopi 4042 TaxID=1299334 RepID=X8CEA7_MYCXE|nr:hypothetical protein I553_1439 [Mycobacterium xenopi 4042]